MCCQSDRDFSACARLINLNKLGNCDKRQQRQALFQSNNTNGDSDSVSLPMTVVIVLSSPIIIKMAYARNQYIMSKFTSYRVNYHEMQGPKRLHTSTGPYLQPHSSSHYLYPRLCNPRKSVKYHHLSKTSTNTSCCYISNPSFSRRPPHRCQESSMNNSEGSKLSCTDHLPSNSCIATLLSWRFEE